MKPNEAEIMKVMATGETYSFQRVGSENSVTLPSVAGNTGYTGGGAIALSSKDNQNVVIIGFGGFIVP